MRGWARSKKRFGKGGVLCIGWWVLQKASFGLDIVDVGSFVWVIHLAADKTALALKVQICTTYFLGFSCTRIFIPSLF